MRLIKLAAFALFGYALYEFVRGMLQDTQLGSQLGDAFNRASQGQGGRQGAFGGGGDRGRGMNISGPGEGERVSTVEPDGGAVGHQVGRGVIS